MSSHGEIEVELEELSGDVAESPDTDGFPDVDPLPEGVLPYPEGKPVLPCMEWLRHPGWSARTWGDRVSTVDSAMFYAGDNGFYEEFAHCSSLMQTLISNYVNVIGMQEHVFERQVSTMYWEDAGKRTFACQLILNIPTLLSMKKWDARIDDFQPFFRRLLAEVRLQNLGKDFAQWSGLEDAETRLRLGIDKAAESLKRRTEKNTLSHISSQIVRMPPQDVA